MRMLRGMRDNLREMRTCHEVGQWLQDYLDGELDEPRTEQVEDHLRTCLRCGLEFDTYTKIVSALHDTVEQSPALINDEVTLARLRHFAHELAGEQGARNDDERDER